MIYKLRYFIAHLGLTFTGRIVITATDLFLQFLPYFFISTFIASLVSFVFSIDKIGRWIGVDSLWSLVISVGIGILSPLATCLAIPLAASLAIGGLSIPALTAFMVVSPLMNPTLFLLTTGELGLEMALARTISAFLLGLLAGLIVMFLSRKGGVDFKKYIASSRLGSIGNPQIKSAKAYFIKLGE